MFSKAFPGPLVFMELLNKTFLKTEPRLASQIMALYWYLAFPPSTIDVQASVTLTKANTQLSQPHTLSPVLTKISAF